MTIIQLQYVYEVAKAGSISKAADNCYVSQSVLSTAISKLEKEIQKPIFVRSARGVTLTLFGEAFVDQIIPLLEQMKTLENLAQPKSKTAGPSIRISSNGWPLISTALAQVFKERVGKDLRVEYYESLTREALQRVASREADIGFVTRYTCYHKRDLKLYQSMNLQFFPLLVTDVGVSVSPRNPLYYKEGNMLSPDELHDSTLIVFDNSDEITFQDLSTRLHLPVSQQRFVVNNRAAANELLNRIDSYYVDSVINMNENDLSWSDRDAPQRTIPLSSCDFKSEFGWVKRKNEPISELYTDVINMVAECLSNERSL